MDREDPNAERKPSIYDRGYTLEEIADLVHLALDHSLDDDLAAVRIAVRRVLQQLKEELSPDEYANLARVIFFGSNAIARLVRTSRDLAESRSEEIQEAIRKAVKEKGQDKKGRH